MAAPSMESRISNLEKDLALTQRDTINLQQNTNSAIQGMQSQLHRIDKNLESVLPLVHSQEASDETVESLQDLVTRLADEVRKSSTRQVWISGVALGVATMLGIVVGLLAYIGSRELDAASKERDKVDRRMDQADIEQRKQLEVLHKIELYLASGGDPNRPRYNGEKK